MRVQVSIAARADEIEVGPPVSGDAPFFEHVVRFDSGRALLKLDRSAAETLRDQLEARLASVEADERTDIALSGISPETPEADR